VPFHHYLILHTVSGHTRVIFNSKELSNVVITTNGFHGTLDGKAGHFKFGTVGKTNAFWLDPYKSEGWNVEAMGMPLPRTKGPAEAADAFKRAKDSMEQFDQFMRKFLSALAAPERECRQRLLPLFFLSPQKAHAQGDPEIGPIGGLSRTFVAKLRAAGYRRAGRSVQSGPFDYLLCRDRCIQPAGGPNLQVERCEGRFLITQTVYLP
jgi:hypothetical protein